MEEKINRLVEWMQGRKAPPFEIQINPTNKCNLKCIFCRPEGYDNIKETGLPVERWVAIIKEAVILGVKQWNILGGEPFIEPKKIIPIMEAIKKERVSGIMSTNGTLLNEEHIKKLINIEWDDLIFSLDGAYPETHDYLRGQQGVFEKCTNTIKLFNHHKSLKRKDKPRLQLFFVITNRNYKELPEFIKLAKDLKINKVVFQAMIQTHPPSKELKIERRNQERFKQYARQAQEAAEKENITTNLPDFLDCTLIDKANETNDIIQQNDNYPCCYEPWYLMQISAEGYINPCCNLESKAVNIKQEPINKIWYGKFFESFRKKMLYGKLDLRCSRCCSGQILRNRVLKEELKNKLGDKFFKDSKDNFLNRILRLVRRLK
jgi:MoaA/NifB/PqqE/SkfB family radical SAM enzyme